MNTSKDTATAKQSERLHISNFSNTPTRLLRLAIHYYLTPRQAEFANCYYFEKMSLPEIAKLYGVGVSSVSRTLKRAKIKIEKAVTLSFMK